MPYRLGEGLEPVYPRRRNDVIPLTVRRTIGRQPIQRWEFPKPPSDEERLLDMAQADALSTVLGDTMRMQDELNRSRQLHMEQVEAMRLRNQIEEQAIGQHQQGQWDAIAEGFAPRQPSHLATQTLAMRPDVSPDDLYEQARHLEGSWRARDFMRSVERMPPEHRELLSPMAAALAKEGLDPETFEDIVTRARAKDPARVKQVSVDQRKAANRVLKTLQAQELEGGPPTPAAQALAFQAPVISEDDDDAGGVLGGLGQVAKGLGRGAVLGTGRLIGGPYEATGRAVGELGEAAIESVSEGGPFTAAGRGELAEGARETGQALVTPLREGLENVYRGVQDILQGEQEAVTPFTRPAFRFALTQAGVPEGAVDWMDRYFGPFLVPSTVVGFGVGGKGARALQIARRGVSEGLINMLQGDAAAERGEPGFRDRTDLDRAIDFVGGGLLAGLAPEIAGPILRRAKETRAGQMAGRAVSAVATDVGQTIKRGLEPIGAGIKAVDEFLGERSGRLAREATVGVLPEEAAPIPEAASEVFYHGTAGAAPDRLSADAFLTPNRADAEVYAQTQARLTGEEPTVVEVRAEPGAVRPSGVEGVAAARGAVQIAEPDRVHVLREQLAKIERPLAVGGAAERPPRQPRSGTPLGSADEVLGDAARVAERSVLPTAGGPPTPDITFKGVKREIDMAAETQREAYHRAASLRAAAEAELRGLSDFLKLDERGTILEGVRPKREGLSLEFYDVASRPQNYEFDDVRIADFFNYVHDRYLSRLTAKAQAAGVLSEKLPSVAKGERYFPRTAVEREGERAPLRVRGGGKQPFERRRSREFTGQDDRVRYLNHPAVEVGRFIEEIEKRLADQEFYRVVNRYGETPGQRIPQQLHRDLVDARRHKGRMETRRRRVRTIDKAKVSVELEKARNTYRRADQHLKQLQRTLDLDAQRAEAERFAKAAEGKTQRAQLAEAYGIAKPKLAEEAATATRYAEKRRMAGVKAGQQLREAERKLAEARVARDDLEEIADAYKRGGEFQLRADLDLERAKLRVANARRILTQAYSNVRAKPGEATLPGSFAGGRVFPRKIAETVVGTQQPIEGVRQLDLLVGTINTALKPAWAALDLSFTFLQMLPSLMVNPVGFLDGVQIAMRSLRDPQVYYAFMARRADVVDRMVNKGKVSLSRTDVGLDEFLDQPLGRRGTQARALAYKTVLRPYRWLNDAWTRAINVQSVHLWEQGEAMIDDIGEETFLRLVQRNIGLGNVKAGDAYAQLGAAISHGTGRLTFTELAKTGPNMAAVNRLLPFAGRYYAAWGHLIADAATKGGMQGSLSRRLMAGWLASAVGVYAGVAAAMGQEPQLDPGKPGFLTVTIGGTKVGVGGMPHSILSLAGKIANDPERAHSLLARWARGKSSPMASLITDLVTRSTYLGKPLNSWEDRARYLVSRMVPFSMQESVHAAAEGDWDEAMEQLKAGAATSFGLRGFPQSPSEILEEEGRNIIAERGPEYSERMGIPPNPTWKDFPPEVKEEARIREPEAAAAAEDRLRERAATGDEQAAAILLGREFSDRHTEQVQKLADQYEAGNIDGRAFREGVADADLGLRAQREVILAEYGIPETDRPDREGILQDLFDYFALFDQYPEADTDPDQKEGLFAAIEAFRSGLGTAREEALDGNLHLQVRDIPTYARLQQARRQLREAGYWKIRDDAWQYLRDNAPGAELPDTVDEYRERVQAALMQLALDQGVDATTAAAVAEAYDQRDPLLNGYERITSDMRRRWLADHPDLISVLDEWGYRDYTQGDLPILAGNAPVTPAPTAAPTRQPREVVPLGR